MKIVSAFDSVFISVCSSVSRVSRVSKSIPVITALVSFSAFPLTAVPAFGSQNSNQLSPTCLSSAIEIGSVSLEGNGTELSLQFKDRENVSGVCDYHVSRMEYVPSLQALLVDLVSPQPCLNERLGKRVGTLKWTLPSALRSEASLKVVVNRTYVGAIAIGDGQAQPVMPRCISSQ